LKALIADDSLVMRHFLTMTLAGFHRLAVDHAKDGVEALELATRTTYAVILLDLNMPRLNGLRFLAELRKHEAGRLATPVIMITTTITEESRAEAERMGAHVMAKPAKAEEIQDAVARALKQPIIASGVQERRAVRRLPMAVKVNFEGRIARALVTEDVSPMGAFLISDQQPPVGSRGRAALFFPHLPLPIEVDCTVVHTRPKVADLGQAAGFAVRFDPNSSELSARLTAAFLSPAKS
jgi:two-component system, chemotaxis family, chemotaxis protein CheY